jgi:hypothetical protein
MAHHRNDKREDCSKVSCAVQHKRGDAQDEELPFFWGSETCLLTPNLLPKRRSLSCSVQHCAAAAFLWTLKPFHDHRSTRAGSITLRLCTKASWAMIHHLGVLAPTANNWVGLGQYTYLPLQWEALQWFWMGKPLTVQQCHTTTLALICHK